MYVLCKLAQKIAINFDQGSTNRVLRYTKTCYGKFSKLTFGLAKSQSFFKFVVVFIFERCRTSERSLVRQLKGQNYYVFVPFDGNTNSHQNVLIQIVAWIFVVYSSNPWINSHPLLRL